MPVVLVVIVLVASACAPAPAARAGGDTVAVTRTLGTWEGRGSQTIGVVSESGRLRVTWRTSNEQPPGGVFRLTLHSGVSGRPLHVVADHRGEGGATVDVEDDPRPYNFMVESALVDWSFTVEETVAAAAPR